jgi:hypothetical protein
MLSPPVDDPALTDPAMTASEGDILILSPPATLAPLQAATPPP